MIMTLKAKHDWMESREKATPEQITRARDEHGTVDLDVDNDALVSVADDGVWVQAWVWLPEEPS